MHVNAETCRDLKMVALLRLALVSQTETSLPPPLPPHPSGPAMGNTCEPCRGSQGTACHLTHGLWSASRHVSSVQPSTLLRANLPGESCMFFFSSVFCSFSEHYCLSSFSQAQWLIILLIVWRRITTGPPSYKKRKINLIPDYLSPWQETIFESCFLVQSPLC